MAGDDPVGLLLRTAHGRIFMALRLRFSVIMYSCGQKKCGVGTPAKVKTQKGTFLFQPNENTIPAKTEFPGKSPGAFVEGRLPKIEAFQDGNYHIILNYSPSQFLQIFWRGGNKIYSSICGGHFHGPRTPFRRGDR